VSFTSCFLLLAIREREKVLAARNDFILASGNNALVLATHARLLTSELRSPEVVLLIDQAAPAVHVAFRKLTPATAGGLVCCFTRRGKSGQPVRPDLLQEHRQVSRPCFCRILPNIYKGHRQGWGRLWCRTPRL